jgi:hypothetical protein
MLHSRRPYPSLTPEQSAYLAGLFDGEGCIIIYARKTYASLKGKTTPHHLLITLTNTHEGLMKWLHQTYGGYVWAYKRPNPATPNRSRSWKWSAMSNQAAFLLKAMLPYLIIKHEQALVALEFQTSLFEYKRQIRGVGRGRRGVPALPPEVIAYRESLRLRLLELRAQEKQKYQ